jgi:hypothetical protein
MLHLLDTKSLLLIALAWAAAAYLIVPALWVRHFRRHPFFAQAARITQTGDGHPGDPINIGLVGSEEDGFPPTRSRSRAARASPRTPCCAAPTTMRR